MAGRFPAGVICEILNDDGTMARGADLVRFAERHGLIMVSIQEIVDHLRSGQPSGPSYLVRRDRERIQVDSDGGARWVTDRKTAWSTWR